MLLVKLHHCIRRGGMSTHRQQQQSDQEKKRTWFSRRNVVIATIVIVALLITTAWILSILNVIPATWATIITAVLTVATAVFTFIPAFPSLLHSETPGQSKTPSSSSQLQGTPDSSSSPDPAVQRGIAGLPPPTNPRTIQPRAKEVQEVYVQLTQDDTTAVVLTGIGGAGKSTLAALVSEHAEKQRIDSKGPFMAEALWLRVDAAAEIGMTDLMGNLMEALGKALPDMSSLTSANQAAALFNALNTTEKARLVILDQFETLLDSQTGHARVDRPGVGELIDAFNSQPCRCRVLLTSRLWPTGTREYPPASMQEYAVKGLESAEGIELLRKQGVAGTDDELRNAVSRCDGHALSLTLFASLLRSDRSLNLQALLTDPLYARLWTGGTGKIAQNLLDYIYTQQLNEVQRQLLLAFSIYREPVPLAAVEPLLRVKSRVAEEQLLAARDVLLAQHLLQAMGALRYQLHSIVASYAHDHFDERSRDANQEALRTAHTKAAQYHMQQAATDCLPRKERRKVSDVQLLIEATWHYGQAGQWQEAYDLMKKEGLFADLSLWGGNAVLLELDRLLLPPEKWHAKPVQAAFLNNNLGAVYDDLGQKQEALRYFEQALAIWREVGDRRGEGRTLWNTGALYFERGRNDAALACFLLARDIYGEVLSPNREGVQGWIDDLREEAGKKEFAALLAKVEPQASSIVEQALREGL
jgi:tetratricopeptide (TPR) repeat protein